MRTATIVAASVVSVVLWIAPAWSGGGGGGDHDCAMASRGSRVQLFDDCFQGRVHTVRAGTPLHVTNMGFYEHTLTAGDGSFDSGTLRPGESAAITVDAPGIYPILCAIHGWYMSGTLVVEGDGSDALRASADGPPWLEPEAGFATAGLLAGAVGHRWWSRRRRA
jgi:plastocyanin